MFYDTADAPEGQHKCAKHCCHRLTAAIALKTCPCSWHQILTVGIKSVLVVRNPCLWHEINVLGIESMLLAPNQCSQHQIHVPDMHDALQCSAMHALIIACVAMQCTSVPRAGSVPPGPVPWCGVGAMLDLCPPDCSNTST